MPDLSPALSSTDSRRHAIVIGRYLLHRQIARGGMATIHIARLVGDEGFTRIVAAKRLHAEFAEDQDFVSMFLDEARVASKIHHRNVVPVLDVVTTGEEVVLVQEYVHGAPLHWLLRTAHEAKVHVPLNVAVAVACGVLAGLQAAHETTDEMGAPLNVVHRDVSPQNIMIATDGTPRLLDFGIAKATMAAHITREGVFKGKLAYSAPEQIRGQSSQQSDVYSLAVVLWELIVGHRLHHTAQSEAELIHEIMHGSLPAITEALAEEKEWLGPNRWRQLEVLDPIIRRGLAVDRNERWKTAADMEAALSSAVTPATPTAVAQWLKQLGKDFLALRDRVISAEEQSWRKSADAIPSVTGLRRISTDPGPSSHTSVNTVTERPPTLIRGKMKLWVGAGATAFIAVLALIVWLAHSPDIEPPPPPRATTPDSITMPASPAPSPARTAPTVTAPPPAATPTPTATATVPTPAPAAPTPAPSPPPTHTVTHSAPAHPASSNRVVHTVSHPSTPPVAKEKDKEPTPALATSPTAGSAAPANDCNPPYYFEGKKKIFKPACI